MPRQAVAAKLGGYTEGSRHQRPHGHLAGTYLYERDGLGLARHEPGERGHDAHAGERHGRILRVHLRRRPLGLVKRLHPLAGAGPAGQAREPGERVAVTAARHFRRAGRRPQVVPTLPGGQPCGELVLVRFRRRAEQVTPEQLPAAFGAYGGAFIWPATDRAHRRGSVSVIKPWGFAAPWPAHAHANLRYPSGRSSGVTGCAMSARTLRAQLVSRS